MMIVNYNGSIFEDNDNLTNFVPPQHVTSDFIKLSVLSLILLIGAPLNSFILVKQVKTYLFTTGPHVSYGFLLQKIHLNLANLVLIFIYCLGQIFWIITYSWKGGDFMCRVMKFLWAFLFHTSSFIVVTIALDRLKHVNSLVRLFTDPGNYRPLNSGDELAPAKKMLGAAWLFAALCSGPQLFVWMQVEPMEGWKQCQTIWTYWRYFASVPYSQKAEKLPSESVYLVAHMASIFWIPFTLICVSYTIILYQMAMLHRFRKKSSGLKTSERSHLNPSASPSPAAHRYQATGTSNNRNTSSTTNLNKKSFLFDANDTNSYAQIGNGHSSNGTTKSHENIKLYLHRMIGYTPRKDNIEKRKSDGDEMLTTSTSISTFANLSLKNSLLQVSHEEMSVSPSFLNKPNRPRALTNSSCGSHRSTAADARSREQANKVLRSSAMIVMAYVLCWLPYNLFALAFFVDARMHKRLDLYADWSKSLTLINGLINPLLYDWENFCLLFRRMCQKCARTNN